MRSYFAVAILLGMTSRRSIVSPIAGKAPDEPLVIGLAQNVEIVVDPAARLAGEILETVNAIEPKLLVRLAGAVLHSAEGRARDADRVAGRWKLRRGKRADRDPQSRRLAHALADARDKVLQYPPKRGGNKWQLSCLV